MELITRNNVLRRADEPRLEMLRLRTSIWPDWYGGASMPAKATSAFLEWKRRTSPISAISWGPRAGPTPNIPITTRKCTSRAPIAEMPHSGSLTIRGLE